MCVMMNFVCFFRDPDNAIIRPLPKIKRMISDNACLPHIVQVIVLFWLSCKHLWRSHIQALTKFLLFFTHLSYC